MADHETLVRDLIGGRWQTAAEAASCAVGRIDAAAADADVAYFEPRMQDRLGHFAVLAETHDRLCQRLGLTESVFHHLGWTGARPARWWNVFPLPDHLVGAPGPVDQVVLDAFTRYTALALRESLAVSGARVGIFPTARYLTLPGIAAALNRSDHVRGAIIGVMETTPVPDCDDEALVEGAFRTAATRLARWERPLLLIAESERIADWLNRVGFDANQVVTAPYPAAARFANFERNRRSSASVRLGAFGATRPVQNPGLLADYLERAPMTGRHWTIKMNFDVAAAPDGRTPGALRTTLDERGIRLLPLTTDRAGYDAALADLDVMVLPYGERYRTIGSGIFLECLCAGVVPLVPEASTMRQLYVSLGGAAPPIGALTRQGIDAAVEMTLADLDALRVNAAEVRQAWLAHPNGPRAWERRVTTFLRSHAAT